MEITKLHKRSIELAHSFYINSKRDFLGRHYTKEQLEKSEKLGYYPFIPNRSTEELISAILKITAWTKRSDLKFLDLGCGVGNIMLVAELLGLQAKGVEVDQDYIVRADYPMHSNIILGDLLEIDTKQFEDIDIYYAYVPLRNSELMLKVLTRFYSAAKQGAYLIFFTSDYYTDIVNSGWRCVDERLYIYIK